MEPWITNAECTGCGACTNICPKNAINMVENEFGFKVPIIDNSKCINCGLCKSTCPIINSINKDKLTSSNVYAGWSNDDSVRYTSTSGGLFTELTKIIIKKGGYVIGAKYNKENMVEHAIAHNYKELEELKQSKYIQSDTKNIFKETKELLENKKQVIFCGSPCQIAALYTFLKIDYPNLITIEFICRGMNSPKAYKAWLSEIELKEKKTVKKVWFKYKKNGWKKSPKCTRIDFEDDTYKIYNNQKNLFMRGYLESNLYIRPSCGNCKFNGISRNADITLADFWGIKKELDDDKGTSLILINTTKGQNLFNNIKKDIFYEQRNIEEIYKGNMCFTTSVKINKKSEKFLKSLNDKNFSTQLKKYGNNQIFSIFKRKIKRLIRK